MQRSTLKDIATKAALLSTAGDFGITISTMFHSGITDILKSVSSYVITILTIISVAFFTLDFFLGLSIVVIKPKTVKEDKKIGKVKVRIRENTDNYIKGRVPAEKLNVSEYIVSKNEQETPYPEIEPDVEDKRYI